MSDNNDGSEVDSGSIEQNIALLRKRNRSQAIPAYLFLLLSIGLLIGSVVSIASQFQPLPRLNKNTPDYHFKLLRLDIKAADEKLREDLVRYHEFMQRDEVVQAMANAKKFITSPIAEEESLVSLIENYRSAMFNIASNVRGSGEYHRFYRARLRHHIDQSRLRMEKLKQLDQD